MYSSSDAGQNMRDKREQYRAELRRLQHRDRQRKHRKDIIAVSILNGFQQLEERLPQLLQEQRLEELTVQLATLQKEISTFEG